MSTLAAKPNLSLSTPLGDPPSTFHRHARNGAPVCIRPLRPDDREREIAFIHSLSEESRYLRLFTPAKFLPLHLVEQLMNVDGHTSMAFVATIDQDQNERFIGIARYGVTDQPHVAELGITVADDWQRQGIATQLIHVLMQYARRQGITHFTGWVLAHNSRMLALAKSLGFAIRPGKAGLVEIKRAIDDEHSDGMCT